MKQFKPKLCGFIQNPVKHLRWTVSRKQLMAKSRQLFSQNAPV